MAHLHVEFLFHHRRYGHCAIHLVDLLHSALNLHDFEQDVDGLLAFFNGGLAVVEHIECGVNLLRGPVRQDGNDPEPSAKPELLFFAAVVYCSGSSQRAEIEVLI